LSLFVAPDARFPTYGTRSAAAGGTEIYSPTVRDARFGWGVTLGFTLRGLNWREQRGVAIWLPELTVGESADSKAFAAGSAISFGPVKLGAGAMWVRHTELVDQAVGDKIPNAGFLQTAESYGRPKLYTSLSIFEWPPFLAK
jgi:hypothetical protein